MIFYFRFVFFGDYIWDRDYPWYFLYIFWSMIISGIFFISLIMWYPWLMIIFFSFLGVVLGYGYIILVIWGLLNYLYHRTGIYLFDFFFVCVFWDSNVCDYIILILWSLFLGWVLLLSLKYDELWFKLCLLVGNVNPFIVKDNDYYLIVMVVNFFDINMICMEGFSWPSFGWAAMWIWYSLGSDVGSWSIHSSSIRYLIRDITVL